MATGVKVGRASDIAQGYFRLNVASHVAFYRLTDDAVEVIRILHKAMDAERNLKT